MPFVAIALPGTLLAALSLGMLITAAAGTHPMWKAEPVNISEAAALRDGATVVRLVQAGESPSGRRRIRAGILFDRSVSLTPLEAAIAAERAEIVDLLLSLTEGLDAPTWTYARCLAVAVEDKEIERVLDIYKPQLSPSPAGALNCSEIRPPW